MSLSAPLTRVRGESNRRHGGDPRMPCFRHLPPLSPPRQLTAVVGAPPLDAHVELVAHGHVHGQGHAGLLHILGVPDPQVTERLRGDLGRASDGAATPNPHLPGLSPSQPGPEAARSFCRLPTHPKITTSGEFALCRQELLFSARGVPPAGALCHLQSGGRR